jgi:hypothetical protein
MYKTMPVSDLYFRIYNVYHINDKYAKCKVMYFYKSNNNICTWLNPDNRPKTYKISRLVYDNMVDYHKEAA